MSLQLSMFIITLFKKHDFSKSDVRNNRQKNHFYLFIYFYIDKMHQMCLMSRIAWDASGVYGSYSAEYGSPIQGGKHVYSDAQKYAIWCRCLIYNAKNKKKFCQLYKAYNNTS